MSRITALTAGFALALTSCAAGALAQTAAPSQPPKPQTPKTTQAPKTTPAPKTSASAAEPDSRELNMRAYVELLRSDIRSQKVAILTEVMEFNEKEDAAFWPIYREYDTELQKLNDERVALIQDYAKNFEAMTEDVADRLAKGALDLEGRRNALKLKYYERVKQALSPKMAARFLQVENQMLMLIDLQISASLPVVR
jgi:hypothetical protein